MSNKKLVQIQRYLIIAILFLICIALILGILIQHQNSQNLDSKSDFMNATKENRQEGLGLFKEEEKNEFDIFKPINDQIEDQIAENNHSVSILEQKMQDIELNVTINDQNQSFVEQNISLDQNQSFNSNLITKDVNLSQDQNLSVQEDMMISKNALPKLAIIIDDMANINQVRNLKALNLKLNPSFFPPDKNHSDTPQLALGFDFYMVHLPLAAINYDKPEIDTLNPNDDQEKILNKIKQIKKDFKELKYINNHTGSLFTSDEKAMRNLYKALISQNLSFVDSKTIGNSKASKVAKELGEIYIQRDVFLDNEDDVAYVKKQLESVIKLAEKKGFAIAIGHPRKNTFKALEQSKDLLKSVELVYLSEIYGK